MNSPRPILAVIFRAIGWIELVGGLALAAMSIAGNPIGSLLFAGGAVLAGIISFGIAEILDHVAASAFYARKQYELLSRQHEPAGSTADDDGWKKTLRG